MNLNSITFSAQAKTEKIKYESNPIIDFDKFSSNGIKRSLDYEIIDSKIAFEESFEFRMFKLDSSDIAELENIDGTEVSFQSYDFENIYNCTCSISPINMLEKSQLVKGYEITLIIININTILNHDFNFLSGNIFSLLSGDNFDLLGS